MFHSGHVTSGSKSGLMSGLTPPVTITARHRSRSHAAPSRHPDRRLPPGRRVRVAATVACAFAGFMLGLLLTAAPHTAGSGVAFISTGTVAADGDSRQQPSPTTFTPWHGVHPLPLVRLRS